MAAVAGPLATRAVRAREQASTAGPGLAPDEEIPLLVAAICHRDTTLVQQVLEKLLELTLWQEQNQREVAELGGPSLLVQLIRSRMPYLTTSPSGAPGDPRSESPPPSPTKFLVPTQPGADVDIQTVIQALNLLTNLSANDDLAAAVALIPGCPGLMVTLLGHPHAPVAVHAARVLINLTHSCAEAQAAAVKAGILRHVFRMLQPPSPLTALEAQASAKLGAWLLANLTTLHGAPARQVALSQPGVVSCLVQLVGAGVPAPIVILAAQAVANLARAGHEAQSLLAAAGAVEALAAHVEAAGTTDSKVLGAALSALSALALNHGPNCTAVAGRAGLARGLSLALEARSVPWDCDTDDARAVLAGHTLVHVLGHMLCNQGQQGLASSGSPPGMGARVVSTGAMESLLPPSQLGTGGANHGHSSNGGNGNPQSALTAALRSASPPPLPRASSPVRPASPPHGLPQLSLLSLPQLSNNPATQGGQGMGAAFTMDPSYVGPTYDIVDGRARVVVGAGAGASASAAGAACPRSPRSPKPYRPSPLGPGSQPGSPRGRGLLVNAVNASPPSSEAVLLSGGGGMGGPASPSHAQQQGQQQQAVYISLSAAARAAGVELPTPLPVGRKDGSGVLTPLEAAELRHRVTHVLLPRLRSPNHRTAAGAAACLYHLGAACGGPSAREARRLMADGALVSELLTLLARPDPALAQACLAVLDVLCAEPLCAGVMMASPWLEAVEPVLESADGLVRRWAERALCSLYMATGGPGGLAPAGPAGQSGGGGTAGAGAGVAVLPC